MKNSWAALFATAFLTALASAAFAQGTDSGVIRGAVTDASSAVIPNAKVTLTDVATNFFSNPKAATRNFLLGPGTWGVNVGVQKRFRFGEHAVAALGAGIDNLFNHPLVSSTDTSFANLGSFSLAVDPNTGRLLPITRVTPNPDFGRLIASFAQDGIDSRRAIRLRLRITF